MDKILIMGAGIYQVPLIETAKRFGLHTIVASIPGDYPGFSHADEVYYVNTTDKEGILKIARDEKISGICTAGTDVAVATIGYVNKRLGLHGISEEAALITSDKALMQDTFKKCGVSSARHKKADSPQDALAAAEDTGYPVVVKCVDSSGSRGITIVEREEDMKEAFEEAVRHSRRSYVIVEEKLEGEEIGVDGIVQDGRLLFLAPHRKYTYRSGDNIITAGHVFPFEESEELMNSIRSQTEKAVGGLGLDHCAINIDAFVNQDEVSIIEIGGRSGATCIPELITMCYDFDYYEVILQLALGQPVDSLNNVPVRPSRGRLIMSPADGIITKIDRNGLDEFKEEGILVSLDYDEGKTVERVKNGTDRIGQVIAEVENDCQMDEIMRRVHRCLSIDGHTLEERWKE